MVGSCRAADDEALVAQLQQMAQDMGIAGSIKFKINVPFSEILSIFQSASIALHTMKFEHFGITPVEMMAAGILVIAHNSAGPKLDIVGPADQTAGFLATDLDSYLKHLLFCIEGCDNQSAEYDKIKCYAREWVVKKFAVSCFEQQFYEQLRLTLSEEPVEAGERKPSV